MSCAQLLLRVERASDQGTVVLGTKLLYLGKLLLFSQNGRALGNDVTTANISVFSGVLYVLSERGSPCSTQDMDSY